MGLVSGDSEAVAAAFYCSRHHSYVYP